jgi:hypothetical protein
MTRKPHPGAAAAKIDHFRGGGWRFVDSSGAKSAKLNLSAEESVDGAIFVFHFRSKEV